MKIGVAQTRPVTGDIERNVAAHRRLTELAVSNGAELVVFPELSVTGYEPTLAKELATAHNDCRFDIFQTISDAHNITIGIGAPTKHRDGICISLILFQPGQLRGLYSKMHLHADEEPFFVPGPPATSLIGKDSNVALAICYELSVPEHAANAFKSGADIYIASAAKAASGIEQAQARLREIARQYSMTVLMSNCIGTSDGGEFAGRTAVWNKEGVLLSQLDDANEGIIVLETETQDVELHTGDTNRDEAASPGG